MGQSRVGSLFEAISNTAVGYIISVAAGQIIYPAFGLEVSLMENAGITLTFTVLAIARSFTMRRYFNHRDRERY